MTGVGKVKIVTDLQGLDTVQLSGLDSRVSYCAVGLQSARGALSVFLRSFFYDYALLRFSPFGCYLFCLLKLLMPFHRCRLVTVDLFIRPTRGRRDRLLLGVSRFLLRQVHLILVHVKDTRRYEDHLRLGRHYFRYVPFKVNQLDLVSKTEVADDGYLFSGGLSRRDFATLFEAMRGLPYRLLVVTASNEVLSLHGSALDAASAPANVEVIRSDGSMEFFLRYMARARLVVIPLRKDILTQAGIAVYLQAMALRKCVIISCGPGVDDVLDAGQACIVPAADSQALRAAIEKAFVDEAWREGFADRGYAYAMALGGDSKFLRSMLEELARDAARSRI